MFHGCPRSRERRGFDILEDNLGRSEFHRLRIGFGPFVVITPRKQRHGKESRKCGKHFEDFHFLRFLVNTS